MRTALSIENLSKRYRDHLAVRALSLSVPQGCIYGILGPNGAGKTTTLRLVLNIISRDTGQVSILGVDPAVNRAILNRVGYLPEERGLYRKMSMLEVIVFFARLRGLPASTARVEANRWIDRMDLGDWRRSKVESLSKGMQQKVQFITTVIHGPELLILDEPTSGLDPVNQQVMREVILEARQQGRTVVLSTHNMEQAEEMCESVCIVAQGEKVLDGSLRDIRRAHAGHRYVVQFASGSEMISAFFKESHHLCRAIESHGEHWEFDLTEGSTPRNVLGQLNSLDVEIVRFEHKQASLHDIFLRQVAGRVLPQRREAAYG